MADTLKEKIDTNKNNVLEIKELKEFIKNPNNLQELANHLNQETFLGKMEPMLESIFCTSEIQDPIKEKLGKQPLTDTEIQLLYLQYLTENPGKQLIIKPTATNLFEKYGGKEFISYLVRRYPTPNGYLESMTIQQAQLSKIEKSFQAIDRKYGDNTPKTPLPEISFVNFHEDMDCNKSFSILQTRAETNYPNEYSNAKVAAEQHHGDKNWRLRDQYVKYELLQFALGKYYNLVETQHNAIKFRIYANETEYNAAIQNATAVFQEIEKLNQNFPFIIQIKNKLNRINNELEQAKEKHFGKGDTVQKQYEDYQTENAHLEKSYDIENLLTRLSLQQDPQSELEVKALWDDIKLYHAFQEKQAEIGEHYGDIIAKYEAYQSDKHKIINKYGAEKIQKWTNAVNVYNNRMDKIKKEHQDFDLQKYETYINKLKNSPIERHRNNINHLNDKLSITSTHFPLLLSGLQKEELKKLEEQQSNERWWKALKEQHPFWYHVMNTTAATWNSFVNGIVGTGFSLGAMITNLWHTSDEMVNVYDRKERRLNSMTIQRSQAQTEAIYTPEKGININWDNGPGVVIEGIVNMFTIVYGGGAFAGGLKSLGMGAKLAAKGGLFTSGFLSQMGNSYEEGFKTGLRGKELLLYSTVSAGIQGGLELISPNEFLLGGGNRLTKQLIADLLRSKNKLTLMQVGKLFLKHVITEMGTEDIQESLQLAAGNLINLRANDQFDLGNGFDVNWDRKNFAATAIITSLTTGIVAGVGFKNHHNNHHPIKQYLQNNPQLYTQVMQTLHQSINGEQHIPNITKEDLIQLQKELEIGGFHKFDGEIQFEIPLKNGKCEYLTVGPHGELVEASLSNEEAAACFKNGLTTTGKLFEGYENRCILSSGSLFLNNPEYRKLGGDIDVATDVQTFEAIALQKGKQGRTKLEEYQENGKIRDLMFTDISHHQLTISDLSPEEISTLIARGDIRVEFNIIDDNGHLINCEFFPEPKGFGLIQVGTERTQGKINTYNLEGTTLQTVNPELAAMSYIVNLAHEFESNNLSTFIDKKGNVKLKDSVRINNLFQYLHEAGIETVQDIKDFITKTKENYAQQVGEEQMITTKNGEKIAINQSQYLKSGLDKLDNVLGFFNDIQSLYTLMQHNDMVAKSWGTKINYELTFNQFMKETYTIKTTIAELYQKETITDEELNEVENQITTLIQEIDIHNPKNFAYFYEIQICVTKYFNELLAKRYRKKVA